MKAYPYTIEELLGNLNDFDLKHTTSQLHVAGDAELFRTGRRVAVVGSRNASELGIQHTRIVVKELVEREFIIVRGLARGIDTVVHNVEIEFGGKTAEVLGMPIRRKRKKAGNESDLPKPISGNLLSSKRHLPWRSRVQSSCKCRKLNENLNFSIVSVVIQPPRRQTDLNIVEIHFSC